MRSIGGISQMVWGVAGGVLCLAAAVLPLSAQGSELSIRNVAFSGNRSISSEVLATRIRTTNSDWLARFPVIRGLHLGETRLFDPFQFRNDAYDLVKFYQASGFDDVKIDTTLTRVDGTVSIRFTIVEGEPTRIRTMAIEGADQVSDRFRVVRDLPVARGDIFNRYLVLATRDSLTNRLRARGFPSASTEVRVVDDSLNPKLKVLRFQMTTGPKAVFGPIYVRGFDQVDSAFIVSLLTLGQGQPYREEEIYRSQRALNTSQLFSFSSVQIDTVGYLAADSVVVPIRVDVVEGKMHVVRASGGYAVTDCLRLGAGWTGRNVLGKGRVLDLSGQLSKIGVGDPVNFGLCPGLLEDSIGSRRANYSVDGSLRRNGFLSPDNTLIFSVFSQRRSEFKVYSREEVGLSAGITRETYSHTPITLSYRLSYGQTNANPATFCGYFNSCTLTDIQRLSERSRLATVTLSSSRTRVNNPLDPSRGLSLTGEVSIASRYLGSSATQQYVRVVGEVSGYLPLARSWVLALHLKGGRIVTPTGLLADGSQRFIPPEQRFYAGGPNDIRGYDRNELGPVVYVVPRDSVNFNVTPAAFTGSATRISATGGDRIVVFNTEVRFPSPIFPKLIRGAAFVDMGMLGAQGIPTAFRITPGAGVRVIIPRFAPLRLDVAYNGYQSQSGAVYTTSATVGGDLVLLRTGFVKPRSSSWTFHFAFGQAF